MGQVPPTSHATSGPVVDFEPPAHWNRKQLRSMGRVRNSPYVGELALTDAGLLDNPVVRSAGWVWLAVHPSAARRI